MPEAPIVYDLWQSQRSTNAGSFDPTAESIREKDLIHLKLAQGYHMAQASQTAGAGHLTEAGHTVAADRTAAGHMETVAHTVEIAGFLLGHTDLLNISHVKPCLTKKPSRQLT
jgi:hypothetical protein